MTSSKTRIGACLCECMGRDRLQQAWQQFKDVGLPVVQRAGSWAASEPLRCNHDGCAKGLSAHVGRPHFSFELEFCMLAHWRDAVS